MCCECGSITTIIICLRELSVRLGDITYHKRYRIQHSVLGIPCHQSLYGELHAILLHDGSVAMLGASEVIFCVPCVFLICLLHIVVD